MRLKLKKYQLTKYDRISSKKIATKQGGKNNKQFQPMHRALLEFLKFQQFLTQIFT